MPRHSQPPELQALLGLLAPHYLTVQRAVSWMQSALSQAGQQNNSVRFIMQRPHVVHAAVVAAAKKQGSSQSTLITACAEAILLLYLSNKQLQQAMPDSYMEWAALAKGPASTTRTTTVAAATATANAASSSTDSGSYINGAGQGGRARKGAAAHTPPPSTSTPAAQALESSISLQNLQGTELSEQTVQSYASRARMLSKVTGNKSLAWLMKHPDQTLAAAKKHSTTHSGSLMNLCTMIASLYKHHPDAQLAWPAAHQKWQEHMHAFKRHEDRRANSSTLSEKQKAKLITYEEVVAKYCQLERAGAATTSDKGLHMEFLLLAVLVSGMAPKRADMGNVHILRQRPKQPDLNYLLIQGNRMTLVIQKHKTTKTYGALTEELPAKLVGTVQASLRRFPRKYLFTAPTTGGPFLSNNAFSHWFARTMKKHFGRALGCSLWRAINISANMSFDKMSIRELEERARLAGHSLSTAMRRYRYIDLQQLPSPKQNQPAACASNTKGGSRRK